VGYESFRVGSVHESLSFKFSPYDPSVEKLDFRHPCLFRIGYILVKLVLILILSHFTLFSDLHIFKPYGTYI